MKKYMLVMLFISVACESTLPQPQPSTQPSQPSAYDICVQSFGKSSVSMCLDDNNSYCNVRVKYDNDICGKQWDNTNCKKSGWNSQICIEAVDDIISKYCLGITSECVK